MTSQSSSYAERASSISSSPKVQVQRSISRETITIHFSAFGKEEEEEEEEEFKDSSMILHEDQSFVPGLKEKESTCEHGGQLLSERATSSNMSPASTSVTVANSSSALTITSSEPLETSAMVPSASLTTIATALPLFSLPAQLLVSTTLPSEVGTTISASTFDSAPKSVVQSVVPSSSLTSTKPFSSLVKSLSTEVEPKEATTPLTTRHLMKTLVKSLSTDTSKQESEPVPFRTSDSRINLHLFKQFTQPRVTGGDSKTAPSSPITSPSEGRSFFKVTEVEARIEDTKRRLSEVIYEPFQLLNKIIGDDTSSLRHKALSSSATELSTLASLNGHLESNNNYSIKEEEYDSDGDYSTKDSIPNTNSSKPLDESSKDGDTKNAQGTTKEVSLKASSLGLEKCSLSVLASKDDDEYYDLYLDKFEIEPDEEIVVNKALEPLTREEAIESESKLLSQSETESEEQQLEVPVKTLLLYAILVYSYLVLPLPSYLSGLFLGICCGFMVAIGVVWLVVPRKSKGYQQSQRRLHFEHLTTEPLDIKEPEIFKGWMNEISNYDPETYHATMTHSVFVRLEGTVLRLSKPNKNISRRASFNEAKTIATYISQKIYDISDSRVHLVPKDLARKRVWNKKYPICIELAKQDDFMSKMEAETENMEEKLPADKIETAIEEPVKSSVSQEFAKPVCQKDQVLYLFGRTGREKEEWFGRFISASKLKVDAKRPASLGGSGIPGFVPSHSRNNSHSGMLTHSRSSSKGSVEEIISQSRQKDLMSGVRQKMLLDYTFYMARYIPEEPSSSNVSPIHSAESSPTANSKLPNSQIENSEQQVAWVNALVGRVFWDFLGEKYWSNMVSRKIQMKLSKIRLPYFMNELTLTELDMGAAMPKICQASRPSVNHQGLWIDLEISYNGSFLMTLETKMNLAKLGKEPLGEGYKVGDVGKEGSRPKAFCLADSDEESSSAGSSDEEDAQDVLGGDKVPAAVAEGYVGGHRPSKIMRLVDKITKSKYFQKATETEFIKKKIEEVSNTPLLLTVEVQECKGTLAVNIPPPPTDRIWYGFRTPPHLELKARPKLGEREVTIAHVTDWIEKKLEQEFQKIFVMPNMDDVYVPIMHSVMDPRSSTVWPSRETPTEVAERL
ncbi:testis-expressed protein 2 [Hemiscyllium ocellatum]|uniref:testis-expressed protein 2 n=1 Tax=Hemiscyllium ocellatum TaxID=170820 RepID=UPI002965D642|nr:testis-expressed protein 2 [Hemiscyllium ocellatum]XP_060700700.1 testis-expressed protein 2 [Hemiscyllium ocellatum]XP_060700701.1 testis-expressed protein 2 [Hemiscyllium ocellatum]